jgi:PhnB protein
MATTFDPYLFFSGDCREAFSRYHEIFGGDLNIMSNADSPDGGMEGASPDSVLHAAIVLPGGGVLMGSDDPTGTGGPKWGVSVSVSLDGEDETRRVYDALAEGGSMDMPLEPTFFAPLFGSLTDRWGVSWLVGANPVES